MAEAIAVGTRCARCSAAVRAGAPWCTQCYAPTAAPVDELPAPPQRDRPVAEHTAREPAPAPPAPSAARWPCSACSQANDLAAAACAGCGEPFLAGLRADRPRTVLPWVGDLLALTPARRVALAVGIAIGVVLVTALLALLAA